MEVVIAGVLENQRVWHCILHGRNSGSAVAGQALANSLMAAIAPSWTSNLAPFQSTSFSLTAVTVRDMTSSTNPAFVNNTAGAVGSSASPGMPPYTAIVLSGKGVNRGKGMSARMYLPGWADNANTGAGVIAPALMTGLGLFGTALFNAFSGSGLTPTVAHPARQEYTGITGTVHPARSAGMADIQNWVAKDNIFDTARVRSKL